MIQAVLSNEKIYSNSIESFSLFEKSRFGEKKDSKIEYSFVEALFLVQEEKLSVLLNSKLLEFDSLLKKISRIDKKIQTKLTIFSDLRKRGYIVKTALKFGADFRVYEKGIKPGED